MPRKTEKPLRDHFPDLAREWDSSKNGPLTDAIGVGSHFKAWWICPYGHSYQAFPYNRVKGQGCPYCSGHKLIPGSNDLATMRPDLALEWCSDLNGPLQPTEIKPFSNKKAWWRCSACGHVWHAQVSSRSAGYGCPECAKRIISEKRSAPKKGESLIEKRPQLAKEWDWVKNGNDSPYNYTEFSNKAVWWKCKKGHSWKARIAGRTKNGRNCPKCSEERRSSFPEQAIYWYISKAFENTAFNRYLLNLSHKTFEVDIFIPSLMIGIEYNGEYWHKDKGDKDVEKRSILLASGVRLFRVIESSDTFQDRDDFFFDCHHRRNKVLSQVITELINSIEQGGGIRRETILDVDVERDELSIINNYERMLRDSSIAVTHHWLLEEWDEQLNGDLDPEMFSAGSHTQVWWKCQKNHSFKAAINKRAIGHACPYCSNQSLLKGYNDMATTRPDLAAEWNTEKNAPLRPCDIFAGSGKKVWWTCKLGHQWQDTPNHRSTSGRGCPICAGRQILQGFNDLESQRPDIASEWCTEKNGKLKPNQVTVGSSKRVFWKCSKCGRVWAAPVASRTRGYGCSFCSQKERRRREAENSKEQTAV